MGYKILVECNLCGEPITAGRGDELVQKQKDHIKDCHPGFEEVHNDYKEENS